MRRVGMLILAAGLWSCREKTTLQDLNSVEVILPNGARITAEAAREQYDLMRGIAYRDRLPAGHGMLFFYPKEESHPHWMYYTRFPVDIVWMDHEHRIVEMALDTQPCASTVARDCPNFGGRQKSHYVLEVNAGVAAKNGLKLGDKLDF
jgi:uncharacterized membrane protein (UPF0127 family)